MACNEVNCINLSCAWCFDCQQSLCLQHIIDHHDTIVERSLSLYEIIQQLYIKLRSMSIEQCFRRAIEQLTSNYEMKRYSTPQLIAQLRHIREELIEQLNAFKQTQMFALQSISERLRETRQGISDHEANEMGKELKTIQQNIDSLVYGMHLEMCTTTQTIQCRKIFRHRPQSSTSPIKIETTLTRSSSWTNGFTENYWTEKNDMDERLSLL